MSSFFRSVPVVVLLLGAACDSASSRDAARPVDSTKMAMPGMAMPGMSMPNTPMAGMSMPGASSDSIMRGHLAMMQRASADSLLAQLPRHRQLVANMLSRMAGEMRQMNMPADAAWNSTVDSLRQDLIRMPDLTGAQLGSAMPSHLQRVARLSDMHQRMMQSMPR